MIMKIMSSLKLRIISFTNIIFLVIISIVLVWPFFFKTCNARQAKQYWNNNNGENNINIIATEKISGNNSSIFNVLDYGAKGDGKSDDTKAFEATWDAACIVEASTIIVPAGSMFLIGPISFSGPDCKSDIIFQLDGNIIAPTRSEAWGSGLLQWIEFTKLKSLTFKGKGIIDGQGSVWWNESSNSDPSDESNQISPQASIESDSEMPHTRPTALRFYGSDGVTVSGITIQNSARAHLKFDNCKNVEVFNIRVSSPGDSPNTDGIHLQNSQYVDIFNSTLSCGDDCVSIQTGCSNVYVHDINCGPGHGISIGSLGRDNTKACVSNITVRDVKIHNSTNGVRIKTWQGGSGSVENVMFSNVQVSEVKIPIIIDQFYCDKRSNCPNETSAVAVSGINYMNVKGTYTGRPVYLACSDSLPCTGVSLNTIELTSAEDSQKGSDPFCWEAYGEIKTVTVPRIDCLKIGKPLGATVQSNTESC